MFRVVKFLLWALLAVALVVLGVANMRPVTLSVIPDGIDERVPSFDGIPLSLVIFVAILIGVVVGEIFEWSRERKHRRQVKRHSAEIQRLRAENARLKTKLADPKEDLPRIAAQ